MKTILKNVRAIKIQEFDKIVGEDSNTKLKFPINNSAFEDLKNSIKNQGILNPIYVDSKGFIISGHYRYWAAVDLEMEEVPVVIVKSLAHIIELITN